MITAASPEQQLIVFILAGLSMLMVGLWFGIEELINRWRKD